MIKSILLSAVLILYLCVQGQTDTFTDFDIEDIIDIQTVDDVTAIREALVEFMFGKEGFPYRTMPDSVVEAIYDPDFQEIKNLLQINRLAMEMEWGLNSIAYLFVPDKSNKQLVIYHQGHNGKFSHGKNTIEALLAEGFHVVGMSMPLLGMNRQPVIMTEEFGEICISSHDLIPFMPPSSGHPVRYFLDPLARVVNYVMQFDFDRISMTGISGGGWTTTLYAALDTRIDYSFPVAGSLPMYLRVREDNRSSIGDYEQFVPEVYRIANYLELYILGSYGENRRQVQILNEFDECCFWGRGYKSYEGILTRKMEELGKGSFRVILDSSHREHKISSEMIRKILTFLAE